MAIIKCELDEQERGIKTGKEDQGEYTLFWKVCVDDENHSGLTVLIDSRQVTAPNDPVPQYGDVYSFLDGTDEGAYALEFECNLLNKEDPYHWYIKVEYKALSGGKSRQQVQEPNPLKWDPEYWIEYTEEQVPVEKARCLGIRKASEIDPSKMAWFSLSAIKRGPYYAQGSAMQEYDENAPVIKGQRLAKKGPIVNAAGQQTIDPLTRNDYRFIICAQINLRSYLDAVLLHQRWEDSTNLDVFLGAPPRSWKWLGALPEKRQEKEVSGYGTVVYYPTVVRLEYRPEHEPGLQNGWDLKFLNNGQVCVRHVISGGEIQTDKYINDPTTNKPALFPVEIRQIKSSAIETLDLNPDATLTEDDFEFVEASEPVNLNWDGTPLLNPEDKAQHIYYRYLEDKMYTDMTYNNGFQNVSIF